MVTAFFYQCWEQQYKLIYLVSETQRRHKWSNSRSPFLLFLVSTRAILSVTCGHVPTVSGPEQHRIKPLLQNPMWMVTGISLWAKPILEPHARDTTVFVPQQIPSSQFPIMQKRARLFWVVADASLASFHRIYINKVLRVFIPYWKVKGFSLGL